MNSIDIENKRATAYFILFVSLAFSLFFKLSVLDVGAPFVTIDDNTTYEGGFLVWFGNAPPQRMYLESWINGLSSLSTYVVYTLANGGSLGINIVADAYNHYVLNPEIYVKSYRLVSLAMDLITAIFVYLTARIILSTKKNDFLLPALATSLYLLTYNTIWCYVVARPDAPTVLFSTIGLYFYYRSDFGRQFNSFMLAAVFFGLATGLKLHGAFFVVFILMDLIRVHGIKAAIPKCMVMGGISIIAFTVAAGSPLFDPLLYIKLRALNVKDDSSPWIEWGDQFFVILEGTGFLIVPLIIAAIAIGIKVKDWKVNSKLTSIIFISILWLVLFSSIRQMRAYWMLPALPLFYIAGVSVLKHVHKKYGKVVIITVLLTLFSWQSYQQSIKFSQVPFGQLSQWVKENVQSNEAIFIFGFDAIFLPLSNKAVSVFEQGYTNYFNEAKANNVSFTERHVRFWEERAKLTLFDMYKAPNDSYTIYSHFKTPIKDFEKLMELSKVEYFAVWDAFLNQGFDISATLKDDFKEVARVVGPGGGGAGLSYTIYERVRYAK